VTVDPTAETAAETGRAVPGPAAGDALGKYRLDRVIGAGGMGIVWAAFDPDLERAVAIKLLRSGDGEPTLRARLLREARAMARLKHPNVLTVYEVGTVQSRDYIAMELVDGDNLDDWLSRRPPREQVLDALVAAGRGLAAAHDAGLVHRDFKPHNVLRSRDGHVYVTDFGLARGSIEEGPEVEQLAVTALPDDLVPGSQFPRRPLDSVLDSPLTQTGVLIGTPAYMAPEQFAGRAPDVRSDQFAFCITAWEALTGKRPFRGSTLPELAAAAAGGVRSSDDDLPAPVRAVLARGLDPDPEARWPDLHSLLRAFTTALAPVERPRRRRGWIVAALVGGGAIAISVGLSVVLQSSRQSTNVMECGPAEEAFAGAWSPARRAAVKKAHPGPAAIGGVAVIDSFRGQWIDAYNETCAAPPGPDRDARLHCLGEARDDMARATSKLTERGSSFEVNDVVSFATKLALCGIDFDDDEHPGIVPPVPPVPPVPGVGPRGPTGPKSPLPPDPP
jgi:serine/threonine protein kinase